MTSTFQEYTVLKHVWVKRSRKAHTCWACQRRILAGSTYRRTHYVTIYTDRAHDHAECVDCVREWNAFPPDDAE